MRNHEVLYCVLNLWQLNLIWFDLIVDDYLRNLLLCSVVKASNVNALGLFMRLSWFLMCICWHICVSWDSFTITHRLLCNAPPCTVGRPRAQPARAPAGSVTDYDDRHRKAKQYWPIRRPGMRQLCNVPLLFMFCRVFENVCSKSKKRKKLCFWISKKRCKIRTHEHWLIHNFKKRKSHVFKIWKIRKVRSLEDRARVCHMSGDHYIAWNRINRIESVQRPFTKRLTGYDTLDYKSRLKRLHADSLELRRPWPDLYLQVTRLSLVINGAAKC